MQRTHHSIFLLALGSIAVFTAVMMLWPSPAKAQCGSQASSCKNCHEVQGQDPVNTEGAWHMDHAFFDACANCHAGNVQATDAESAHTGMVAPLSDIQANCVSCHGPDDSADLAGVYAITLGVEVGAGGSPPPSGDRGADQPAPPDSSLPPVAELPAAEIVQPDVVDFNQRYAEATAGGSPLNVGNLILGALIGLVAVGGGGYVLWNERRLRAPARRASGSTLAPTAAIASVEGISPEVAALLPRLEALTPIGKRALARLLDDPSTASDLLHRLSRLDRELVLLVRDLDPETRSLLLALGSS